MIFPPEYGRVYEVPLDPVTRIEAALVSVTVRVAVCPEEMVLGLAVIETVGAEAAALAVNTETATKVRIGAREEIVFTGPALIFAYTRWRGSRLVD